jgi:hypothetical protein
MDNLGKNWQLINILFCGYQRRLEIGDCRSTIKMCRNLNSPGAQGAPASNNKIQKLSSGFLILKRPFIRGRLVHPIVVCLGLFDDVRKDNPTIN